MDKKALAYVLVVISCAVTFACTPPAIEKVVETPVTRTEPTSQAIASSNKTIPTVAKAIAPLRTPTPIAIKYHVGNTDGDGVFIRRTPAMADKIKAWPDGTEMVIEGAVITAEGRLWRNVRDPDGNVGFVPAEYLIIPQQGAATLTVRPTTAVEPDPGSNGRIDDRTPLAMPRQAAVSSDILAYDRGTWRHWIDADADCQDARQEVLIAESVAPVTYESASECRVDSGTWFGPYTGEQFNDPGRLDIDHMVPLANAHRSGAWAWDNARKRQYANDLSYAGHLIATKASANRSKGSHGPEDWKPPLRSYWCTYAVDWITIKVRWDLTATAREIAALKEMLATCGDDVPAAKPALDSDSGVEPAPPRQPYNEQLQHPHRQRSQLSPRLFPLGTLLSYTTIIATGESPAQKPGAMESRPYAEVIQRTNI